MAKEKRKKHPGGRPSKYDPKYCRMVIDHMEHGLSFESFAGTIEVSRDTLYEWTKVHEEFSDAFKIGQMKCRLFWERLGINGVAGKIPGFQVAGHIYNMKVRFGLLEVPQGEGENEGYKKALQNAVANLDKRKPKGS
jgi:hypothetical protein